MVKQHGDIHYSSGSGFLFLVSVGMCNFLAFLFLTAMPFPLPSFSLPCLCMPMPLPLCLPYTTFPSLCLPCLALPSCPLPFYLPPCHTCLQPSQCFTLAWHFLNSLYLSQSLKSWWASPATTPPLMCIIVVMCFFSPFLLIFYCGEEGGRRGTGKRTGRKDRGDLMSERRKDDRQAGTRLTFLPHALYYTHERPTSMKEGGDVPLRACPTLP